jgi:Undecaprenyl-phosphate glucose phosphotransferase
MFMSTVSDQLRVPRAVGRTAADSIDAWPLNPPKATKLTAVFGYMLTIEFLVAAAATYFGSILYHYVSFGTVPPPNKYISEGIFIATMLTVISLGFRHFEMAQRQQLHMLLWSGTGTVALAFAFFLSTIFLLKISTDYSRGAFIFQIISVSITICTDRAFLLLWFRTAIVSGNIETSRAILIGDEHCCSKIIDDLRAAGTRVVASFSLPRDCEPQKAPIDKRTPAQNTNIRKVADQCRTMLADDIVILAGREDLILASNLAHLLSKLPCNTHIAPLDDVRFLTRSQVVDFGNVKTLRLCRRPLSWDDLAVKRTFDIVVAAVALIALSPLLVVTALAIKLDSRGDVFFRQLRHGYNNKEIRVLKFRTMISSEDENRYFKSTTENDVRITTLGQILRRTNIDELPQLFNVLCGEMSIVGPRPHATAHNEMFEDKIMPFARRHNVKPGITGWAQVKGYRGPADTLQKMQKRIEYDLFYIDNWSFFFDFKIILMTLFSREAYKNAF